MTNSIFPLATILVPDNEEGSRLDLFLSKHFKDISREKIKTEIKKGNVCIEEFVCTLPKQPLRAGQTIEVSFAFPTTAIAPEDGTIEVLYKDTSVVVINKPSGITVHPCPSCPEGTLANRLVASFPELCKQEGFRPGIVHRLDKDTSGLMLVALEEKSRLALSEQFAKHTIYKEYLALVYGVPTQKEGIIEAPIGRDSKSKTKMAVVKTGRYAKSSWRTLYADSTGHFSVVAVRIFTGRTHQIRVHMAHMGHPLIGDTVYGFSKKFTHERYTSQSKQSRGQKEHTRKKEIPIISCNRQMLHAWHLSFEHPYPQEIDTSSIEISKGIEPSRNLTKNTEEILPLQQKQSTPSANKLQPSQAVFLHEQEHHSIISATCTPPHDFITTLETLTRRPLQVIITGMPGCGKSTVLKELQMHDVPVFSADNEVAKLYAKDGDGTYLLKARYGDIFLTEDGTLDKKKLGKAMRESSSLRKNIEAMIHPLVYHASQQFFSNRDQEKALLAVAEVPLFFESGGKSHIDTDYLVVGVHCPFSIRAKRLAETRGWSDDVIASVESWQLPEDKKMQACDKVIDNTSDQAALKNKVKLLYNELLTIRSAKNSTTVSNIQECWQKVVFP